MEWPAHGEQHLVAAKHGLDIEQTEPRRFARRALRFPRGSAIRLAQHLKAAAEAEDAAAAPDMRLDDRCPSPHCERIRDRRCVAFEPGRTTRSASPGSGAPCADHDEADIGLGGKRIEIVEIGDMRQDRHRDRE